MKLIVTLYLPLGRFSRLNFPETSVDAPNTSPVSDTNTTFAPSRGALLFSLNTVPETEISIDEPISPEQKIPRVNMIFVNLIM